MELKLIKTLTGLRGNPRACVYTEPLWGLSMNLCFPYASVYMLAIGLNDYQIGFIATLYMLSQVLFAFISGPLTDKLGRRTTTLIFDFLAWAVPSLIWWRAQNIWFFIVAALLNGMMQITMNSWECLLIEDADKSEVTGINTLVVVSGQLSVLFAPISAILFSRLTLVPAIRILYLNAFVVMTLKVLLCYIFSRETRMGKIRMSETRGKSVFSIAAGYGGVLKIIAKSRGTTFAIVITALVGIVGMINTTFWQILVSKRLLVPDPVLPLFPILRSAVAIVFLFLVVPRITGGNLKMPLLAGFASYFIGQTLLIFAPVEAPVKYIVLCTALLFDGFGFGALTMLARSLVAFNVNPEERARVMAILNMSIIAINAPFGWIGGILSSLSRIFPFILNLCLLVAGFYFTFIFYNPDYSHAGNGNTE